MTTIADIRKMIAADNIEPETDNILFDGTLQNAQSKEQTYYVYNGLDPIRANLCDSLWGSFNLKLIEFIKSQKYSKEEFEKVASSVQLDDYEWDWLTKVYFHKGDEYEWFFLDMENKPQAACLIYHPKKSAIDSGDIFYIEYVAVAPWNRNNPMEIKHFKGAGTEIIKCAIQYATKSLGLRYGFSLHALARAEGFYEKIGMTNYQALTKDTMKYYEMSDENSQKYMGVL
jgi:hypothetical protein